VFAGVLAEFGYHMLAMSLALTIALATTAAGYYGYRARTLRTRGGRRGV